MFTVYVEVFLHSKHVQTRMLNANNQKSIMRQTFYFQLSHWAKVSIENIHPISPISSHRILTSICGQDTNCIHLKRLNCKYIFILFIYRGKLHNWNIFLQLKIKYIECRAIQVILIVLLFLCKWFTYLYLC